MKDLEKRKEVYGICGECNETGTGWYWCQPCNAKRFKENFENWTSGNKDIDELIQYSQLNTTYRYNCLEWIPYEKFKNIIYIYIKILISLIFIRLNLIFSFMLLMLYHVLE